MARRRKKKKEERDRGVKLHREVKKKKNQADVYTGQEIQEGNEKRGCDEEEHERKEENEKD